MSATAYPTPRVGQASRVKLDTYSLEYVPQTLVVEEAQRFGEKISTGSLRYADFNPEESAHSIASFAGGYGLRRYSDAPDPDDNQVRAMYHEADGVDCRDGIAILSPEVTSETLPSVAANIAWLGEFIPSAGALSGVRTLVCIAGTKIWYRDTAVSGTWTDTGIALAAAARKNAIGVFGGNLVIGFGTAAVAVYTTNLSTTANVVNSTPANIYVGAFTADRAAAYVAGGPTSTDVYNKITSSTNGATAYDTSLTTVGSSQSRIRCLAPGGGLALVYVLKDYELASIDSSGIFHILLPFDSVLPADDAGLHWWLGRSGDQQRGPVIMLFSRDRSPWIYQPSSDSAGEAVNIAPWSNPGLRPETIRGIPEEFQGSATWLYYAIHRSATGHRYLLARNALNGYTHSLYDVGTSAVGAMTISSLVTDGIPRLFYAVGTAIKQIRLPLDGDSPLDDANSRYTSSGTLTLAEIDLGFPDEPKNFFSVNVVADNLSAGSRAIAVEASIDGDAYISLGTVSTSPSQEVSFPTSTYGKRVRLRLTLSTTSNAETPQLLGLSVRMSLNPKLYRTISFDTRLPTMLNSLGSDNLQNPKTVIDALWAIRRAGQPVTFRDRWNDSWSVRLTHIKEQEIFLEPDKTLETVVSIKLLEVAAGAGNSAYGNSLTAYGALSGRYA